MQRQQNESKRKKLAVTAADGGGVESRARTRRSSFADFRSRALRSHSRSLARSRARAHPLESRRRVPFFLISGRFLFFIRSLCCCCSRARAPRVCISRLARARNESRFCGGRRRVLRAQPNFAAICLFAKDDGDLQRARVIKERKRSARYRRFWAEFCLIIVRLVFQRSKMPTQQKFEKPQNAFNYTHGFELKDRWLYLDVDYLTNEEGRFKIVEIVRLEKSEIQRLLLHF